MTSRYAIYAAPGFGDSDATAGALRTAAESWLGRSASADASPGVSAVPSGWSRADVDAITVNPRRYGFHATFKAPFRLASGRDAAELTERLAEYTGDRDPVVVPALTLACLNGFFALVAGAESATLQALGDTVVRDFDDLRAPATEADIARHRPELLDAGGREMLHKYGYPYRFVLHFTLTDPVPAGNRAHVESALREHFAALIGRDLTVGSLAVFLEPAPGEPFVLASSHPFRKAAQ